MASAHAAKEDCCSDGAKVCPSFHTALEVLPSPEAPTADVNPAAAISTNQYYSARTQWMIENRNKFPSQLEFEIECSKVHHTSVHEEEDNGGDEDIDEEEDERELILQANRKTISELREHPLWWERFQDRNVGIYEVGEKIGEGGEATIYAGVRTDEYEEWRRRHVVVKVYRRGYYLRDLVKQWPERTASPRLALLGTYVEHVMLMPNDGRIAMVMEREWGDLRRLIDLKKEANRNQGPPFDLITTLKMMTQSAYGMRTLHMNGVVHRDLKASNVLLYPSDHNLTAWERNVAAIELPLLDEPGIFLKVSDFECALGVMGTGFWRAPEVLMGMRDPVKRRSPTSLFTTASDVYSYGMTCYEVVTGFLPFEREGFIGTKEERDRVISGERPTFPDDVDCMVKDLIMRCWQRDESARPAFAEIVRELVLKINECSCKS